MRDKLFLRLFFKKVKAVSILKNQYNFRDEKF